MSAPDSTTRHTLATLDLAIIEVAAEATAAREAVREARARAEKLEELKVRLMDVRDAVRPVLDPSAPRAFPYDSREPS